jgi:Ca2+:H+ antiporter
VKAKWLNVLLVAVPAAALAWYLNRGGAYFGQLTGLIFGLALVAVIPLASLIGQCTDILERYVGERLAGLLGASFGNVPELAIGIALLINARQHLENTALLESNFTIIRGLLIGSIINNVLFVLGSSTFIAALRNGRMKFSAATAATLASMLGLSVVGLALPTLATSLAAEKSEESPIIVSVPFAIILIVSYVAYVATTVFNVGARAHAPAEEQGESGEKAQTGITVDGAVVLADDPANRTEIEKEVQADEAEEARTEQKKIELRRALRRQRPYAVPLTLLGLAVATGATVAIAAILVSVTNRVIVDTPLTPLAVGMILFPIVCNLGEQAGAITSAWRNRMESAQTVAVGSSVQIALFVTPVLILLSFPLALGEPKLILTLIFQPLELIVIGLVTFVYALVSLDGETTWLEGLQLLAFYAMMVAVAFALPGL